MYLLRNYGIKDSFSDSFRRRILINTGLQLFSPETDKFYKPRSVSYEDTHPCSIQIVVCTPQGLYVRYGSGLWQYGKCCYRDGALVLFDLGQYAEEECKRRHDMLVPKHQGIERNDDSSEEMDSGEDHGNSPVQKV